MGRHPSLRRQDVRGTEVDVPACLGGRVDGFLKGALSPRRCSWTGARCGWSSESSAHSLDIPAA